MFTLRVCTALASLFALTQAAPAQTYTGVNLDQNWNDAGDWTPNTVPNSATAAVSFPTLTGTVVDYTVTITSGVQVQSLSFGNTSGAYLINASGSQTLSGVTSISVGPGVTTTDSINLGNIASGSLLFPANKSLTITNNAAPGSNPTLIIGPETVIATPAGGTGGIMVGGTGITQISGSIGSISNLILGGLTKSGSGTLILANSANGYLGGTTIQGGTLSISADGALGAQAGALSFAGGTLQFTGAGGVTALNASRPVTIGSAGGTIDTSGLGAATGNYTTVASVISGTGPLTLNAHGDTSDTGNSSNSLLTLSGANTFTGTVTIASGVVDAASGFGNAANTITITGGGLVAQNTGSFNRSITLGGTGDRIFRVYGGTTLTVGSVISGSGTLRKTDGGTLTLADTNNYAGGTTIGDGTLQIGSGGTAGVLPGNVTDNAALVFNRSDAVTFPGTISGTGMLTQAGSGTLTLTGSGTNLSSMSVAAGAVTLNGGSLALTSSSNVNMPNPGLEVGGASTSATLTVQGGRPLDMSAASEALLGYSSVPQSMTVQGPGTQWKLSTQTDIGAAGAGTLIVQNGAKLTGGMFIFVANGGSGAIQILSGGQVSVPHFAFAGPGSLIVSDSGSSLSAQSLLFAGFPGGGPSQAGGPITVASGGSITISGETLLNAVNNSITVRGGTMTTGSLSNSGGVTSTIALSDPAGGTAFTVGTDNTSSIYSGPISDADLGPGTVAKVGAGTLTLTGHLTNTGGYTASAGTIEFSGATVQPGSGSLTAAAGATIEYDIGARVFGGFLRGPGLHIVNGATFTGTTAMADAVINQIGSASYINFTNGGSLSIAGPLASPTIFNGFTNEGSGAITIGAGSQVTATAFQTYGMLTLPPNTATAPTILTNNGSTPLYFNGGSRTFIGTPATAINAGTGQPADLAGINLNGQNAVVAGGLFVNNGFVADGSAAGTATIVADFGSLVKGDGYFQNSVITQNGGKFQTGNSPGSAAFGNFVFGPGGVNNYVFAIDDATRMAGPHPNAAGQVSGWGLVKSIQQTVGSMTSGGDFTWTATPADQLTVAIDTLINPTTVGTDLAGPMADFDSTQAYVWKAVTWTGSYSGPTDAATLNADTAFDTSGFANPIAGSFGWAFDSADQSLSLTYTPTPVPEPGTMALVGLAAAGLACWRRRGPATECIAVRECGPP